MVLDEHPLPLNHSSLGFYVKELSSVISKRSFVLFDFVLFLILFIQGISEVSLSS